MQGHQGQVSRGAGGIGCSARRRETVGEVRSAAWPAGMAGGQAYFTLPAASPERQNRCRTRNATIRGITERNAPVMVML